MKKSLLLRMVKALILCFSLLLFLSVFLEIKAQSCVPPVAKVNGQNVSICDPTSTFTGLTAASASETWAIVITPANPAAATINPSTGAVDGMSVNGIYRFVLSNSPTCADTVSITRGSIPMAGANQTICSPSTKAVIPNATVGQVWSVLSKQNGTTPTFEENGGITEVTGLTVDGVYTIRITQGVCYDDVQILRKAQPNAGANITTCITTASVNSASLSEIWSPIADPANPSPATIDDIGDIDGMINPGIYRFVLTAENGEGCTDTVQVTKTNGVNVSTQNVSVCTGGIIQLTANSTTSGATYFWKGPLGSGFTSNQQSPAIANASASNGGIYTVTATLGNCSATATAKVTFTRITVSFMSGVTNACVGQNLKVRDAATRQTGDPQVMTYFWSGPNNTNTYTSSTSEIIIPTTADRSQAGEYKLVETYDNGCVVTNTLTLSVTKCQSIGDLVFKDVNNDGLNNNGELGVGNVPIKLFDASNPTTSIATTTTDADGKYLFRDLIPGFYIVEIDAPIAYKSSTGTNGAAIGAYEPTINPTDDLTTNYNNTDHGTKTVGQLIRSGEIQLSNFDEPIDDGPTTKADSAYNSSSNRTIDFGIFQPAKIGDFVWSDTNKNGIQDSGELGVSGVKVNLYLGNGTTPIATYTTSTDGKFLFDNLIAGTYTVEFDKTTIGSTNIFTTINNPSTTTDKDSDADLATGKSAPFTLAAGENNSTIDAGIVGNCPTTALTPTSNSPVCAGTRLELSVAGSAGATYLWTSPKGVTSNIQNLFTQNATIDDKGIWTIAIQYANGCLSSGSITVDIKPALSGVAATATATGCTGDNISLTASPSGAKSYEWTGIPAFTSTVQNPTISKPIADNYTFTVKITSLDGCTALATASTAIYTAPAATASSNSPVCVGSPINLSVSTSATQFAWTGPNSFTATSKTPTILKADALFAGVYTVVVTNANSCTAIATTKVVINLLLNGGDDLSICAPVSTAQLTVVSGSTWQAEPSNPAPATVDATGKVSGLTINGSYVFYITNSSGCNDTVKVFRNEKLDAGNDVVICSPTSTAKLLKLNSGQTWKYFANGQTQPTPSIDANGNVTGVTQEGSYLFILEQTGVVYCADTVAVIRKPSPMAGGDQTVKEGGGICFPQSTAKLQAANAQAKQTWAVATNSFGFGTVVIDENGNVSKMNSVGIYTFVLAQGECTDSVKVEIIAKPNAGTDVEICSDIKTVKLANAPLNMTWLSMATNPVGTLINATTGEVTGLTTAGEYKFILKNVGGCTDTVSVKTKAIPTFDANTIQTTCTIGAANPDAKLILSGFDVANKYDYSEGITYIGTKTFANATIIPTNGVIANSLVNPTTDKSYTVRVFNNTDCFTDKTVVLKVRACECKPDVCLPYSFRKTK